MEFPFHTPTRAEMDLAAPAAPAPRARWVNVALVFACQVAHSLTFVGLALFLPLVREDLHITYTQAGVLSAAATLSYAAGQIPAGFLADRYGARRLFIIGLLGWSVLSAALGFVHVYWLAVLTQFVAGMFRALLFAPGLRLLAAWFPPERGATAMSFYMVGAYTGNILLSLVGPSLALAFGWRATFIFFALLGVCAALAYLTISRPRPRDGRATPYSIDEALGLLRHRILWVCGAIQVARFSVVTGFSFWLPTMLVADRGFSLPTVGLIAAMGAAVSVPGNALGGYLSDRLNNPPLIIGGSLAMLAVASLLVVWVPTGAPLLAVVALGCLFIQLYFGPLFHVPVEVLGHRASGTATGFGNLFANFGGLLTAYSLGAVKDATGTFTWGFVGISVICLLGAAMSVPLARLRKQALARV